MSEIKNDIERICQAICKDVPDLAGGIWSIHATPSWPKEFSKTEQSIIRSIAMRALMAAKPETEEAVVAVWDEMSNVIPFKGV